MLDAESVLANVSFPAIVSQYINRRALFSAVARLRVHRAAERMGGGDPAVRNGAKNYTDVNVSVR